MSMRLLCSDLSIGNVLVQFFCFFSKLVLLNIFKAAGTVVVVVKLYSNASTSITRSLWENS